MNVPLSNTLSMIYSMKCINGHKYNRLNSDEPEYKNQCPECGTFITGITGGRWLSEKEIKSFKSI